MMYERYERIRNEKGLKDSEVAKRAGISPSIISDWKKGRYKLRADKLQKIAAALGVSVSYLIGEEIDGYYINKETAEAAQELFDNPDLRILFDAAKDSKPEDLRMVADMLKRLKETNRD